MSDEVQQPPLALIDHVSVRAIAVDDWAAVRGLHVQSFKHLTGAFLDPELVEEAKKAFASPEYTDDLMQENLAGAWLDGHLIGTCGWRPADDTGAQARITALYVDPLFTRIGVGRRLVEDAEARARQAGFQIFTARATLLHVGFFESLGYEVSSHGVSIIGDGRDMPVTFLRKHDQSGRH